MRMKIKTALKMFLGAMIIIFMQVIGSWIYYSNETDLDWMAEKIIALGITGGVILIPFSTFWLLFLCISLIAERKNKNG
jgi:hypothetical protein